jgi:hypothetical protein
MLGIMHEAFQVISAMQGTNEFKEVEKAFLSEKGLQALTALRQANSGGESSIRSRLALCRNRVGFHYDRESFEEGASTFSRLFTGKDESMMIYEVGSRAYYFYPEQVREIVAFGFNEKEGREQIPRKLGQYLTDVRKLMHEMGSFLDELLPAYRKMKSLESAFTPNIVTE